MNLKKTALRSAVIVGIVLASILFGIIFQSISVKIDKSNYPIEVEPYKIRETVEKYSDEFGVPEYVIFAVIKTESDFDISLLSSDGKIGLMQVSPDFLEEYREELHDSYEANMLYDPDTNIKYGTYRLSKLYLKFGTWRAVYASLRAGEETVLKWLTDDRYSESSDMSKTKLLTVPDEMADDFVENVTEAAEKYKKLYFNN